MKTPCKDCKDRVAGCHSSCELYIIYKHNWDVRKEQEDKLRATDIAVTDVLVRGGIRANKRQGIRKKGKGRQP